VPHCESQWRFGTRNGTADRHQHCSEEAFLEMLGVFAEFENNLRKEPQLEGIEG
jgi:DNA invertase Pin-like site-specific DNA recombinase